HVQDKLKESESNNQSTQQQEEDQSAEGSQIPRQSRELKQQKPAELVKRFSEWDDLVGIEFGGKVYQHAGGLITDLTAGTPDIFQRKVSEVKALTNILSHHADAMLVWLEAGIKYAKEKKMLSPEEQEQYLADIALNNDRKNGWIQAKRAQNTVNKEWGANIATVFILTGGRYPGFNGLA
ncbi:hypothetical protein KEM55_002792, partial [Ascosphaera atra]